MGIEMGFIKYLIPLTLKKKSVTYLYCSDSCKEYSLAVANRFQM